MAPTRKIPNTAKGVPIAKRMKVAAAVAHDISSENDDTIGDDMNICAILDNDNGHHGRTTTSASAIHALGKTIRNTLLEINKITEENRDRRHKELLEVLANIVQHDSNATTTATECGTSPAEAATKNKGNDEVAEYTLEEISNDSSTNNNEEQIDITTTTLDSGKYECSIEEDSLVNNQTIRHFAKLKKPEVSTLKSISILPPTPKPPNIKPKAKANRVALEESKGDLQLMRVQMLEMQRKKMEDRERKKRELLQAKQKLGSFKK